MTQPVIPYAGKPPGGRADPTKPRKAGDPLQTIATRVEPEVYAELVVRARNANRSLSAQIRHYVDIGMQAEKVQP